MCTWVEISKQVPSIPQGLLQTLVDQLTVTYFGYGELGVDVLL